MSKKSEIIHLLDEISDLMEFAGENKFKVAAFRNGANSIRKTDDIEEIIKEKNLGKIKGIGKGIRAVIYEYYEKSNSTTLDELKKKAPEGISDLLKIRGIGPKKIRVLYDELGISSLGELEYACRENQLSLLKGFGASTQNKILDEIEKIKKFSKYILLNTADKYSREIIDKLEKVKSIKEVSVSGELRRGMEIISTLIFVLLVDDINKILNKLKQLFNCEIHKNSVKIKDYPIPVELILTKDKEEFSKELFITTGSKEYLEDIPIDKIKGSNEQEIFHNLKIPYIIPEIREKEYLNEKDKKLKENSVLKFNDFKGLLHFHTIYSDGKNTLFEMVKKAKELRFEYAVVCDHSRSAFYANGLKKDRILLQNKEIVEFNSQNSFHIFHGIESDILQDGSLDYPEEILKKFDFIVASIHSSFNMEKEEMTKRIIKAVENPYTDLLGHPSGRLLLSRDQFKFDHKRVIDACAASNTVIEINANPRRLDLDWRWIYYAREKGCKFSINPDAHSTDDIELTEYGIMSARKGGIQPKEVINCLDLNDFKKFLLRKTKRNLS